MMVKARYVVPVDGPVIEDGAVVVEGDRIAALGPARELHRRPVLDYGDAVICPGFVNAHTHLELTNLAGRVPPTSDFIDWLRRLVTILDVESATRERVQMTMKAGIAQLFESGVTTVGDITRRPLWTRPVFARSALGGVSFGEVIAIGTRRNRLAERLDAAASTQWETDRLRVGISPHAPYTVEPDAMRACAERARTTGAPLCIHLAETAEEGLFTRRCNGPFVEYLRGLGVWDDSISASGCRPVELAERIGLLGKQTVIAHANYVIDADIDRIAAAGASVAYCPRTHHAFGHPPHPFRDMLAAGINVCLGTDSLASGPSLSILDELRFVRREHPDFSAADLLVMSTLHGARALGFADKCGSLTAGKQADLVVIPLETSNSAVGWESILESTQLPIAVYVAGVLQHVAPASSRSKHGLQARATRRGDPP